MTVEKSSNVDRNIRDLRIANLDRVEKTIDDLKLPTTADCTRETALGNGLDAETLRGLLGDNRHARSGVEHKFERRLQPVDTNFENGTIISCFERNTRTVITTR